MLFWARASDRLRQKPSPGRAIQAGGRSVRPEFLPFWIELFPAETARAVKAERCRQP